HLQKAADLTMPTPLANLRRIEGVIPATEKDTAFGDICREVSPPNRPPRTRNAPNIVPPSPDASDIVPPTPARPRRERVAAPPVTAIKCPRPPERQVAPAVG